MSQRSVLLRVVLDGLEDVGRRHWVSDSGEETRDVIRRRVLGPCELELYATLAGFDVVEITDGTGGDSLVGPGAYTVARYRG